MAKQSGFLPIMFSRTSRLLRGKFDIDILTGFEFYMDDAEPDVIEEMLAANKKLARPLSHRILLVMHGALMEPFCGTVFAAALVHLFDGLLEDTYSGDIYTKKNVGPYLKAHKKNFKKNLKDVPQSEVHEFIEWL